MVVVGARVAILGFVARPQWQKQGGTIFCLKRERLRITMWIHHVLEHAHLYFASWVT